MNSETTTTTFLKK